jgi:hypothetical protein
VFYHWPTVVLSLLAAILASTVALYVVSRERMGAWRAGVGSIPMGGGIAAMHYIGMAIGATPIRDGHESMVQRAGRNEPDIQCQPTVSLAQNA